MKLALVATAALALSISACGSDADTTSSAAPSAKASASATAKASASAKATTSAAPSASAAAGGDDPCKGHNLDKGGKGTLGEPCKYSGDIITAKYKGKIEDGGAVFEITNPWKEDVNFLTAAVYYYDKAGKQLTVKVNGDDKKNDFLQQIEVAIPWREDLRREARLDEERAPERRRLGRGADHDLRVGPRTGQRRLLREHRQVPRHARKGRRRCPRSERIGVGRPRRRSPEVT